MATYIERIMERVVYDHGCWTFTGKLSAAGYGKLGVKDMSQSQRVHRAVFEADVGPVAEGMELDHLCRNKACCNPIHLEVVTHEENMRRARRTHCKRGHEFTDANVILLTRYGKPNGRTCRTCVHQKRKGS